MRRAGQRRPAEGDQHARVANRLVKRLRDFAEVEGGGRVTPELGEKTLRRLGIDEHGLVETDRRILRALERGGGPVGLKTIAVAVGEDEETVEDVYEPFLIQQGLLARTPRGRVAMPASYEHLGLTVPAPGRGTPPGLFD